MSNWHDATAVLNRELVALVLAIIREHYRNYGDFPTIEQVLARVARPGG